MQPGRVVIPTGNRAIGSLSGAERNTRLVEKGYPGIPSFNISAAVIKPAVNDRKGNAASTSIDVAGSTTLLFAQVVTAPDMLGGNAQQEHGSMPGMCRSSVAFQFAPVVP